MSLNCREIDRIISELDIEGAQIQKITQSSYDTLLLSCYKPERSTELLLCVAHGACRLHETALRIPKAPKPQRFTELLRAHIRGARIRSIRQLGDERVVRIDIGQGEGEYILYARLWSGAANIFLCKPGGTIVDVLSRKPRKGELAGGIYKPEQGAASGKIWTLREIAGEGSFNARIDALYAAETSELSLPALREKVSRAFDHRRSKLDERLMLLNKAKTEYSSGSRCKELGDLLMANQHIQYAGEATISLEDFIQGGTVLVRVKPELSLLENALAYYEKAKKASRGLRETELEMQEAEAALTRLNDEQKKLEAVTNPYELRAFLAKEHTTKPANALPCLAIQKNDWIFLIGRSAAENDELLRHHIRGNDMWLHARDYKGSYVFIKARAGKTVPLDILLDAGMLAVYYSKGRSNGEGDVYYTQAKYIRRAKNGPKGLVIPTQEKNLHVKIDEAKLAALQNLAVIGRE